MSVPSKTASPASLRIRAASAALGVTAIAAQIILLRESLSVFCGNELIIGIVLASWMVLTAAGAFAGKAAGRLREYPSAIPVVLILLSVLPAATVFALRFFRNIFFTPGSMIGIVEALTGSLVVLLPLCLTSGCAFALLVSRSSGENGGGSVYTWESFGSAFGGLVFNVLLISFLSTFQALVVLMLVDLAVAWWFARVEGSPASGTASVVVIVVGIGAAIFGNADARTRAFLFPGQEILDARDTPYGNLTVTRQSGQVNMYENSILISSSDDVTANEESVHYALVQCRSPRSVLLVGGGLAGMTREVLKYGCDSVVYVEINPWIIDEARRFVPLPDDPRVHVINEDARFFIGHTSGRYDAVLINLPDPSTAQLNRYSTVEFFRAVRSVLNPGGVVGTGLLPGAEYQGHEARSLGSALLSTLRKVFPHVLIVPGERHFFIGSENTLDIHIARLIEARGIRTAYVNRFYIDDALLEQRSKEIAASLSVDSTMNEDLRPVAYSRQLGYWLSYFGFDAGWLLIAVVVTLCLVLWRASPVGAGIFAGGLTASSVQVLLLIAFQTLCGSVYQMTGFMITAFMAGLGVGAGPARKWIGPAGTGRFVALQIVLGIACFFLWPLLNWLHTSEPPVSIIEAVLLACGFLIATLVGLEFTVATELTEGQVPSTASSLYALDLLGSALGAFAASVYVLPKFGVQAVCLMAGVVSLAGSLRSATARKQSILKTA